MHTGQEVAIIGRIDVHTVPDVRLLLHEIIDTGCGDVHMRLAGGRDRRRDRTRRPRRGLQPGPPRRPPAAVVDMTERTARLLRASRLDRALVLREAESPARLWRLSPPERLPPAAPRRYLRPYGRAHRRPERPPGRTADVVPSATALGDAHVCRPLQCRRQQRALPPQPRQGPDRSVGRLRPADPDRLRPRPRARPGRGRQGRRADLAHRRHAGAVRRHPARPDEHLDDDQRHRDVAARDVPGRRRGAGARRRRRPARLRCAPCPARRRTTSSRSTCRAGPTCSRPGRRCG